jgi:hypothetical protein
VVKTLQDDAGRALDLSTIVKTTVSALRAEPVQRGPGGSRGEGVESTFYEVRARLVSAKLEEDNDIHLVIRGITTSGTMIVEFPLAPTCTANAKTGTKTRMKNAQRIRSSVRRAWCLLVHEARGPRDDSRDRLLRLPPRPDRRRAERRRTPPSAALHERDVSRGLVRPRRRCSSLAIESHD